MGTFSKAFLKILVRAYIKIDWLNLKSLMAQSFLFFFYDVFIPFLFSSRNANQVLTVEEEAVKLQGLVNKQAR